MDGRPGRPVAETTVIVFDVNETLSDMKPLAQRFVDVGAPELAAKVWFASLLRDGFALAVGGGFERFGLLGEGALRVALANTALDRDVDAVVRHIMDGFGELGVHPDVPEGVRRLRETGVRLVTLTNGSVDVSERLLTRAGIRSQFDQLLSVESAGVWKPARGAYEYAARTCGVPAEEMMLVAVHPWDIDGAARAGLRTAWIDRDGTPYPPYFTPPELTVAALTGLAEVLG